MDARPPLGCVAGKHRGPRQNKPLGTRFGKILKRKRDHDCTTRSTGSEMARSTYDDLIDFTEPEVYLQEFVDMMQKNLRSCGYPLPPKYFRGMALINHFEEKFPNLDGSCRDVLNDLSEEVAFNLSHSVVSLASFNVKTRSFVCTGIVIKCDLCTSVLTSANLVRSSGDENKIDDTLRIEVCLPNKQCVTGKLQHCSLHYNIAVVNIAASPDLRAANLYHQVQFESRCKVIAVGRIFTSGKLTGTSGALTDKLSKFDCKELLTSTCKIRKAGIGGPLVDFDGNFIGMNFYDEEETPFLPRNVILECRRNFKTEGATASESATNCNPNRWPVPKPYWFYPPTDFCDEKDPFYNKILYL